MDILSISNLSKSFGQTRVIDGISFSVPEHAVFGFIGANGAGKTTTMKMILGLLKADGGEVAVCGEKVTFGATKTNRHIGYLPDVPEFYNYMRPKEYLRLCGEITGLPHTSINNRCDELLELVGLAGVRKKIGGFSRGMKQRLGVAQALLNEPKLLICDEPTSALDPVGRKEILDILRQISRKTTVIFSTHILSDVERICNQAAVLNKGKIALAGTLADLKARHKADSLHIEFVSAADKARFISVYGLSAEQSETGITLRGGDIEGIEAKALQILAQNDILPIRLEVAESTIESLFLEVVQ
ncbi:MAG: ABC transporter ATP-binding protein [Oscillospiraceae bacterium]|jgi:ABC-2 type transport system ATP-binding protein|nr:ABC transporter ATP-binding protein [Oscillospiraceae bacterium]